MKRFDNRTVIVTGGARGMGASHARGFVAEGANVVIADVLEQEGRALADDLGDQAIFSRLDVTSDRDWAATVAATTMSKTELQALPEVRQSTKEVSPMEDQKIYLLAESTILPGFLEEVKAIFKEALIPTLQEPGCEALYETGRKDDPHKLVFFEVFSSAAAHEFHLEQDYTKRMFASLEGKMSGAPTFTKLSAL